MGVCDSDSDCSSQLSANKCVNDTGAGSAGAARRKNTSYERDCISEGRGELQLPGTPTQGDNTETSDFDSVSTTSASYLVTQSDMESLSLDDNQLELLMNKSDLSDLDQLDTKTITGSCSSDEGSLMDQLGSKKASRPTGRPSSGVSGVGGGVGDDDDGVVGVLTGLATDQATEGQDPPERRTELTCQVSAGPGAPLSTSALQATRPPVGSELRERTEVSGDQNVKTAGASPPPRDSAKPTISFSSADSERQERTKRKGSVSNLIARFEASSRSTTPERSLTPDSLRSASCPAKPAPEPEIREAVPAPARDTGVRDTGARPKVKPEQQQSSATEPTESLVSNESERAELRGLKEFTEKYLRQQEARNAGSGAVEEPGQPGQESDIEDLDGMPPTIRRNSGGAYTSYVFISSDPSNDDQASVVSSNGSYTDPENRVTVNVKETCVSPNTCVVSIQDGRTSNISIVSTESSELNSPRQSPTNMLEDPPELPTKVKVGGKSHSELQQIVYATRESLRDFSHRSRGGEADFERDFIDDDADRERSGEFSLTN